MTLFLLAILAGFLTVLAPCILPLLPIILGSGTSGSKSRPLFVVLGFILSFTLLGAAFATIGSIAGIDNETLRIVAVVFLFIFGLALLFEGTYNKLIAKFSSKVTQAGSKIQQAERGKSSPWSGLLIGVSLGLIWTPCAGPILGTILTLAVTEQNFWVTAALFFAYAVGSGLPLLGIAYGGGWFFTKLQNISRHAHLLNKFFGVLVILTAIAIYFGYDRVIQAYLVEFYPEGQLPL